MKKSIIILSSTLMSAAVGAGVLLEGNGVKISSADIEMYVKTQVPEEQQKSVLASPKTLTQIVETLYLTRRLANQGLHANLLNKGELEWELKLSEQRSYMNAFINHKVDKRIDGVDWRGMAKEEYLANKSRYLSTETVEVSHILIKGENPKDQMESVLAELKAGGDFEALAAKYSQDPSAVQNKGNLGYIVKGQMVPPFEKKAFSSPVGEVSEPFTTRFGTHILKVTARKEARIKAFDEVVDSIIDQLKPAVRQRFRGEIIDRTRSEKGPNVNEASFNTFLHQHKAIAPISGEK
ncbi:peptidylprolyl isomerase [uncultured Pseudoteredinibacter sp.]|uniref:peptidylprolyl isomerase n=1 Tax=uncultured Pseudoteredinibacter sp. TaxID=1641701 RepID=UPI0026317E1E|nr:peptidylprolyl isomerase [uncultured Pseudoteredinibacter sp.]